MENAGRSIQIRDLQSDVVQSHRPSLAPAIAPNLISGKVIIYNAVDDGGFAGCAKGSPLLNLTITNYVGQPSVTAPDHVKCSS